MPNPIDLHVGERLKQARTLRGLSQSGVASQSNISFQQVQKYEKGSNRISASRLFEFSQVLEVPPCFFFEGLIGEADEEPTDASMQIVNAVAAIKDEKIKERVVTFIEDVAGVTVVRGK
jgi:transcriptional regulator with XRE-family HTH domain